MSLKPPGPRRGRSPRSAAAAVEFAICLPVLVIIVFGSIEICNLIYVKQVLSEAAYAGALEGMRKDATTSSVDDRVQEVTDARHVRSVTTACGQSGVAIENVPEGETFFVRATADTSQNLLGFAFYAWAGSIEVEVQARKL